ncbi:MAG: rRNA pseudouridine synthase [Alphaproteobacteria bacterium]|nr:rRNA pseudouridine synthase [Thalassospira sp.]MCE2964878.1 rRNA pseudouridine synthase [Alphaproteobacteria bacterium]
MAERIAKMLAARGVASRRGVEALIAEGRVRVNGAVVTTPATLLDGTEYITVDNAVVAGSALPLKLYRFHKPKGCLTTEKDPEGRKTIYDLLPPDLPRLQPIGRLDYNSEGLLLMTTSGGLKRFFELPKNALERCYRVRVHGRVEPEALESLKEGITIDGVRYEPILAEFERQQGANAWLNFTLHEGKNREIRKVCEALGYTVNRLIRTRYGGFSLGTLPIGGFAEVHRKIIEELMPESLEGL